MTYEVLKFPDGSFRKQSRNKKQEFHREDGPAIIWYYPDGLIHLEVFYLYGKFIGENKNGFWALWDRLDDKKRQNQELLKYLVRFS
jgi:hypothetical protein